MVTHMVSSLPRYPLDLKCSALIQQGNLFYSFIEATAPLIPVLNTASVKLSCIKPSDLSPSCPYPTMVTCNDFFFSSHRLVQLG